MSRLLCDVTHRGITAVHYIEKGQYMIWYHKENDPYKSVGFIQVRGISNPLTVDELKVHIDKLWERYKKENPYIKEK